MVRKKKRLMYPAYCDTCDKEPDVEKKGTWDVVTLDCSCGGRVKIDFTKPYYEEVRLDG